MPVKRVLAVGAFLTLAGCMQTLTPFQEAQQACFSYGARYGTPEYTRCMMMKDQQRADAERQQQTAYSENYREALRKRYEDTDTPRRLRPYTCNTAGGHTLCD